MLIESSYAARESQWHQIFAGPLGEMLNMENPYCYLLVPPLHSQAHSAHSHTETRIVVIHTF